MRRVRKKRMFSSNYNIGKKPIQLIKIKDIDFAFA